MSKEQIEEKYCGNCLHYCACLRNAEYIPTSPCCAYEDKAGYRKQSEGEWKPQFEGSSLLLCTACGYEYCDRLECTNFCGNCGAKMKGGAK